MLSQQEQLRYSRQTILSQIGESGQLKLRLAKVLIVGLGGLGNPVSMYLAAAGIGKLLLADGDKIELTNLQRQIMFNEQDIGSNKADCASEKLSQQNADVDIEVIDEMLDQELCDYYIPDVDVVIDCTDNIGTRYLLNQACLRHKVPLIVGAATGFDGQQMVIDPRDEHSACYQCLFPESEKAPANNCQTVGILGPVLAIIGGMQALQTIKLITGNQVKLSQLHLFDGLANQWQQFTIKKQKNCPACQPK
ncbi:HesA/MoeB/ThiF family protein [Thalassotalea sp. PLHSN55]|uniref:HesA/MoeB/ThiF family protein n=1 Tax=Thalassotalea sp. PLHSN55 TaxID=3435888 RepID=UPI003F84CBC5